jgi:hypothetical protein
MSSNLSVINFTVGGTLAVSGTTTLAQPMLSSSSGNFQGLSTTSFNTTGASTFNSLPTSTQFPTSNNQFTTKIYVDTADATLNTRITNTDSAQRTYIDGSYNTLNTRITNTDSAQKSYIDGSYNTLNTRITNTDSAQKSYIDGSYNTLNTRITQTANSIRPNRNYTISRDGDFYSSIPNSNPFNIDQFQFGASTYIECVYNNSNSPFSIILDLPAICGGLIVYIWNNSPLILTLSIRNGTTYFLEKRTGQTEKIQPSTTMFLVSNSVGWVVLDEKF